MKKIFKKAVQPILKKGTTVFVCAAFLATSVSLPQAKSEVSSMSVMAYRSLADDLIAIALPKEIGNIRETYRGTSDKIVVLIQDAHSIPDAQRSIRSIIDHFQTRYGVSLVGLEGASEKLDPQIFRSFPDKDLLRKIFDAYAQRGELTGGTAAALFNASSGTYHGIEDWSLYEEGVLYFLKAMEMEKEIMSLLNPMVAALNREKKTVYSKELLEIDHMLANFGENKTDLVQVLNQLSKYQVPPKGSELALLLEEIQRDQITDAPIEIEIKKITEQVVSVLKSQPLSPEIRQEIQEFNWKFQEFRTARMTPQAFALYLKGLVKKHRIRVKVSRKLAYLVENQKKLKDIEGTRLFEEFKRYADSIKESLFQNDQQKVLDTQTRGLELIKRLTRLELSFEDWEKVQKLMLQLDQWTVTRDGVVSRDEVSALLKKMEPHLAFYRVAEQRDQVFFKNIQSMMGKQDKASSLLVAGGFHTGGLTQTFKTKGISYVLVMPKIGSIPEKPLYREHMQGQVSWSNYFEVKNGKVNLYDAFVRATRDNLLGDKNASSFSGKEWRDQIIRDLAAEGRITQAGEYTRFIDETTQPSSPRVQTLREKWLANIDRFGEGLKKLQADGNLSESSILQLIKTITTAELVTSNVLGVKTRAEIRLLPWMKSLGLAAALLLSSGATAAERSANAKPLSTPSSVVSTNMVMSEAERVRKVLEQTMVEANKVKTSSDLKELGRELHGLWNALGEAEKVVGGKDMTYEQAFKLFNSIKDRYESIRSTEPASNYITPEVVIATVNQLKDSGKSSIAGSAEEILFEMQKNGGAVDLQSEKETIDRLLQGSGFGFRAETDTTTGKIRYERAALKALNVLTIRAVGGDVKAQKALVALTEQLVFVSAHEQIHKILSGDAVGLDKVRGILFKDGSPDRALLVEMVKSLLLNPVYREKFKQDDVKSVDWSDLNATAEAVLTNDIAAKEVVEEFLAGQFLMEGISGEATKSQYESRRKDLLGMLSGNVGRYGLSITFIKDMELRRTIAEAIGAPAALVIPATQSGSRQETREKTRSEVRLVALQEAYKEELHAALSAGVGQELYKALWAGLIATGKVRKDLFAGYLTNVIQGVRTTVLYRPDYSPEWTGERVLRENSDPIVDMMPEYKDVTSFLLPKVGEDPGKNYLVQLVNWVRSQKDFKQRVFRLAERLDLTKALEKRAMELSEKQDGKQEQNFPNWIPRNDEIIAALRERGLVVDIVDGPPGDDGFYTLVLSARSKIRVRSELRNTPDLSREAKIGIARLADLVLIEMAFSLKSSASLQEGIMNYVDGGKLRTLIETAVMRSSRFVPDADWMRHRVSANGFQEFEDPDAVAAFKEHPEFCVDVINNYIRNFGLQGLILAVSLTQKMNILQYGMFDGERDQSRIRMGIAKGKGENHWVTSVFRMSQNDVRFFSPQMNSLRNDVAESPMPWWASFGLGEGDRLLDDGEKAVRATVVFDFDNYLTQRREAVASKRGKLLAGDSSNIDWTVVESYGRAMNELNESRWVVGLFVREMQKDPTCDTVSILRSVIEHIHGEKTEDVQREDIFWRVSPVLAQMGIELSKNDAVFIPRGSPLDAVFFTRVTSGAGARGETAGLHIGGPDRSITIVSAGKNHELLDTLKTAIHEAIHKRDHVNPDSKKDLPLLALIINEATTENRALSIMANLVDVPEISTAISAEEKQKWSRKDPGLGSYASEREFLDALIAFLGQDGEKSIEDWLLKGDRRIFEKTGVERLLRNVQDLVSPYVVDLNLDWAATNSNGLHHYVRAMHVATQALQQPGMRNILLGEEGRRLVEGTSDGDRGRAETRSEVRARMLDKTKDVLRKYLPSWLYTRVFRQADAGQSVATETLNFDEIMKALKNPLEMPLNVYDAPRRQMSPWDDDIRAARFGQTPYLGEPHMPPEMARMQRRGVASQVARSIGEEGHQYAVQQIFDVLADNDKIRAARLIRAFFTQTGYFILPEQYSDGTMGGALILKAKDGDIKVAEVGGVEVLLFTPADRNVVGKVTQDLKQFHGVHIAGTGIAIVPGETAEGDAQLVAEFLQGQTDQVPFFSRIEPVYNALKAKNGTVVARLDQAQAELVKREFPTAAEQIYEAVLLKKKRVSSVHEIAHAVNDLTGRRDENQKRNKEEMSAVLQEIINSGAAYLSLAHKMNSIMFAPDDYARDVAKAVDAVYENLSGAKIDTPSIVSSFDDLSLRANVLAERLNFIAGKDRDQIISAASRAFEKEFEYFSPPIDLSAFAVLKGERVRFEQRMVSQLTAETLATVLKPGEEVASSLNSAELREVKVLVIQGKLEGLTDLLRKTAEALMTKTESSVNASATTVKVTKEMANAMVKMVIAALEANGIKGNLTIIFDVSPDRNFIEALQALKDGIGTAVFTKDKGRKLDRKALEGVTIQTVGSLKSYKPLAAENAGAVPVISQNLESDYFSNGVLFGVGLDAGSIQGEPFLEVAENVIRIAVGLLKADLMTKGLKPGEINAKLMEILFKLDVGSSHSVLSMNGRHLVVHREALQQIMLEYQARVAVHKAA